MIEWKKHSESICPLNVPVILRSQYGDTYVKGFYGVVVFESFKYIRQDFEWCELE